MNPLLWPVNYHLYAFATWHCCRFIHLSSQSVPLWRQMLSTGWWSTGVRPTDGSAKHLDSFAIDSFRRSGTRKLAQILKGSHVTSLLEDMVVHCHTNSARNFKPTGKVCRHCRSGLKILLLDAVTGSEGRCEAPWAYANGNISTTGVTEFLSSVTSPPRQCLNKRRLPLDNPETVRRSLYGLKTS